MLAERHASRTAENVEWKNLEAELSELRALRDEKTVSLNEAARRKERDEQEARRKARELASLHATPATDPATKTVEKIRDDAQDRASGKSDQASEAAADVLAEGKAPAGAAPATPRDDGLQPDERSIANDLKREQEAREKRDVVLDEAAHILADEIALIRTDTKLASRVLPYGAMAPAEVD
jgi:carboxyl-terminal processing protease